ncbi:MmcQ/YjbR family DNA-binding protein [Subtercola lobariae]|nr:MmcQ/YjbR family DNA-binding protein [Subtercola lobariae]
MDAAALSSLALRTAAAFPAVVQSQPFGDDTEVFKVVGKVFAIVNTSPVDAAAENTRAGGARVTLKCAPPHALSLVGAQPSVIPGYHMNKQHWISIVAGDDVTQTLVEDLIGNSYDIVVSLLPRAKRPLDPAAR